MAATVMAGSGNMASQAPSGWLAVIKIERRSYRALVSSNRTEVSAWFFWTSETLSRMSRLYLSSFSMALASFSS